jgi:hypothetical protein
MKVGTARIWNIPTLPLQRHEPIVLERDTKYEAVYCMLLTDFLFFSHIEYCALSRSEQSSVQSYYVTN